MIRREELQRFASNFGLREDVVEKDYAIGWVLYGIGTDPRLAAAWAFKGGTCLKKCFIETYRFSEDLDFTVLPGGPFMLEQLAPVLQDVLTRVEEVSGLDMKSRAPLIKLREGGISVEARMYYRGPRGASPASLKLDLTSAERMVLPTVLRAVSHPYSDGLPASTRVRCYSLDELFAEKIRAMGERGRPRDLYDIVNLFRRDEFRTAGSRIRASLDAKCRSKGVSVPTLASVLGGTRREELEAEWENMLGHQLPVLPPIETFLSELPALFDWLEGAAAPPALPAIPSASREPLQSDWTLASTAWTFGEEQRLEPVRFAALNHLCVDLGYEGTHRLIEPYSMRRTRDGNLLLMALHAEDRAPRSYRVDRIESIQVTNRPFAPVYAIEFAASGGIATPPPRRAVRERGETGSGPVYVVECIRCGRRFRRKQRDTKLRPHKDTNGWACRGSSGHVLDVER